MNVQLTDPELKKQFKLLSYKIKAYGDTKAELSAHVTNDGEVEIDGENFQTKPDQHQIDTPNEITNYLNDQILDVLDIDDDTRYAYFDIVFDTQSNTLVFDYRRFFTSSEYSGHEIEFDELSDKFRKLLKEYKHMKYIEITYDGGGDSGWISDNWKYKGGEYKANSRKNPSDDQFENELYAILDDFFGAWGNDEGSTGTIKIDFKQKVIIINHESYFEDEETINNVLTVKL